MPESQGGKRLVQRCDINAGARINTLFRIKCKPSVSPLLSREIRVAVTERRQATYYGMNRTPLNMLCVPCCLEVGYLLSITI